MDRIKALSTIISPIHFFFIIFPKRRILSKCGIEFRYFYLCWNNRERWEERIEILRHKIELMN